MKDFLYLKKDQSEINWPSKENNKHNNSRSNFHNTFSDKNVAVKNRNVENPQFKVTRKTQFSTGKKKFIVVGS